MWSAMFRLGLRSSIARTTRPVASTARWVSRRQLQDPPCTRHFSFERRPAWQHARRSFSHQQSRFYQQNYNYQRFQKSGNILTRWAARPTFYYEVGGLALTVGAFYTFNLETVPVSGRKRFNVVSAEQELSLGQRQCQQTFQEYQGRILPSFHPKTRQVKRVLDRLIPNSGLEGENWEVYVIEDPQQNAFVIPGGKVFVFSGILPTCATDDGLATVLGHEIAHNVAHHAAERVSQSVLLWSLIPISLILTGTDAFAYLIRIVGDFALERPGSRTQESEADHIGLLMMAKSCYDPHQAIGFWARMEKAEQVQIPEFMSTHPSNHNRLEKIREWMGQAEAAREESGCAAIGSLARDFRSTLGLGGWSQTSWP